MNRVFLIGRLTADPTASTLDSGTTYCRFSIAVNRITRSEENKADFFNIICWNNVAQTCIKYLTKGQQVAIIGSLQTNSYEKDGVRHNTVDIRADQVEFLGKPSGASNNSQPASKQNADANIDSLQPVDDDMPF